MSLHDILLRLAVADDDNTAMIVAIVLNSDQDVRRTAGEIEPRWDVQALQRVARVLAEHSNVDLAPQAAVRAAVQEALARQE